MAENIANKILHLNFNQNNTLFTVGTTDGFLVYNVDPCKQRLNRRNLSGGIGFVDMLYNSNIFALVGDQLNGYYPNHKVIIFDDQQAKPIAELCFRSAVKAVRLQKNQIYVVLENRIYIYSLPNLKVVQCIETGDNPQGILAINHHLTNHVLVCPGIKNNEIYTQWTCNNNHQNNNVNNIQDNNNNNLQTNNMNFSKEEKEYSNIIKGNNIISNAHTTSLECITLNIDGSRIASASQTGTLIRVFNTFNGQLLHEFRRGTERATIYCLVFNNTTTNLACSSNKGTIHIFNLLKDEKQETKENNKKNTTATITSILGSTFNLITNIITPLQYLNSKWSCFQYKLQSPEKSLVCFGQNADLLFIITYTGKYIKLKFDSKLCQYIEEEVNNIVL